MIAAELILGFVAVVLIVSAAFENRVWRWYTRLCRGEIPTHQGHRRLPR